MVVIVVPGRVRGWRVILGARLVWLRAPGARQMGEQVRYVGVVEVVRRGSIVMSFVVLRR